MLYQINKESNEIIDMGDMDNSFFLIGLLNEFMNRFQAVGDQFFGEISWKQSFTLVCIRLFSSPPTLRELSDIMGTSHQNVKQILLKLEKVGYVRFIADETDKRKQRIVVTEKAEQLSQKYDAGSAEYMKKLFGRVNEEELEITVKTILKLDERLKELQ